MSQVQQERLGRSLDRLSKDLYSKDTHFVLELIQNADDNSYHENLLSYTNDLCPSVKFVIDEDSVCVRNNELGFKERDIRALCDVGRSTKGKHKVGYIGRCICVTAVYFITFNAKPHISVSSIVDLRTRGHWFDPCYPLFRYWLCGKAASGLERLHCSVAFFV